MIEVTIHYPIGRLINEPDSDKLKIEFIRPKRPFLWWGEYREAEAIQYPKGYGVAYADLAKDKLLFVPMPFNILVGWFIWSYHWLRVGFASWCWRHRPKI